jgi:hypothetical protein
MSDTLNKQFTDAELVQIREEAAIYMCACPAQVAEALSNLRQLYAYQRKCMHTGSLMLGVHDRIAMATELAHQEMEACLEDVLNMEQWDRTTLYMPAGLRKKRDDLIASGE